MPFDFSGLLAADYATFSGSAILTPKGGSPVTINAIDLTDGTEITDQRNPMLLTVRPTATVRGSDLAANSITPAQLDGGTITLNFGTPGAETWRIESHDLLPMGAGDLSGEVRLILIGQ